MYDIIILGSGPAGLTAALYATRAGKKTLVLGGDKLGGQMAGISDLGNYPGFIGSGLELGKFMRGQALNFGAEILDILATKITGDFENGFKIKTNDGNTYEASAIIIATGAAPKKLVIAGAKEFYGKGVSYCATCDGFFYSGKDVLVFGGGNSALNDALYLANLAKNVKIVYRKSSFSRAEQILIDKVNSTENIECVFDTDLDRLESNPDIAGGMLAITTTGTKIAVDGVFVAIGHEANTDYLTEDVKRDDKGRLDKQALPKGIFAAGDVASGVKMQIATAVGSGCDAAMDAIALVNLATGQVYTMDYK